MMGRMDMGRQIATAPASRAEKLPGAMRRKAMQSMMEAAPVTPMKAGGKVTRGDGACMKGRTKGKMY